MRLNEIENAFQLLDRIDTVLHVASQPYGGFSIHSAEFLVNRRLALITCVNYLRTFMQLDCEDFLISTDLLDNEDQEEQEDLDEERDEDGDEFAFEDEIGSKISEFQGKVLRAFGWKYCYIDVPELISQSFHSLPAKRERKLKKKIACSFVNENSNLDCLKSYVETIIDMTTCDYSEWNDEFTTSGINVWTSQRVGFWNRFVCGNVGCGNSEEGMLFKKLLSAASAFLVRYYSGFHVSMENSHGDYVFGYVYFMSANTNEDINSALLYPTQPVYAFLLEKCMDLLELHYGEEAGVSARKSATI